MLYVSDILVPRPYFREYEGDKLNSIVAVVTRLQTRTQSYRVYTATRRKNLSQIAQGDSGARPAYYSICTGGNFEETSRRFLKLSSTFFHFWRHNWLEQ